jgi:hypothetical protein
MAMQRHTRVAIAADAAQHQRARTQVSTSSKTRGNTAELKSGMAQATSSLCSRKKYIVKNKATFFPRVTCANLSTAAKRHEPSHAPMGTNRTTATAVQQDRPARTLASSSKNHTHKHATASRKARLTHSKQRNGARARLPKQTMQRTASHSTAHSTAPLALHYLNKLARMLKQARPGAIRSTA